MSRTRKPIVAIIPARGGSKRIPGKNLLPLAGRPVVAHSILHARQAKWVDEVIVSTNDANIAAIAQWYGAEVVKRPDDLSVDTATSESALVHALAERKQWGRPEPELVVFLQCTSPVRRPHDIDRAIQTLRKEKADSLLSACRNSRFLWGVAKGRPYSINYDYRTRKREQDFEVQYRENGSIYIFKPSVLKKYNNRLGGKIAIHEMDYLSSFQIDDPEHVDLIGWVMSRPEYAVQGPWPEKLSLVVFDFDGVMTDNRVWVDQDGKESVACNRSDGLGLGMLRDAGVPMMVLSKEKNPVVSARCRKLGMPCNQGVDDKAAFLSAWLKKNRIRASDVAYIGNDINDLPCLRMVGLPVVTGDAHPAVLSAARWVLAHAGGHGAVREFCDTVLARLEAKSE
jgi:YrbI family 3-deoxy-D-manno-octulosonate 8-phosphate phosphatase